MSSAMQWQQRLKFLQFLNVHTRQGGRRKKKNSIYYDPLQSVRAVAGNNNIRIIDFCFMYKYCNVENSFFLSFSISFISVCSVLRIQHRAVVCRHAILFESEKKAKKLEINKNNNHKLHVTQQNYIQNRQNQIFAINFEAFFFLLDGEKNYK